VKAIVKYQVATYSGTVEVECTEKTSKSEILKKARDIINRKFGGSIVPYLPLVIIIFQSYLKNKAMKYRIIRVIEKIAKMYDHIEVIALSILLLIVGLVYLYKK